jgi:hypothetical protein
MYIDDDDDKIYCHCEMHELKTEDCAVTVHDPERDCQVTHTFDGCGPVTCWDCGSATHTIGDMECPSPQDHDYGPDYDMPEY